MKYCPYCTKRLGFFNLVRQRLTFSEEKAICCPSCSSIISTQGGASIWLSLSCGAGCGGLIGMFLGNFSWKGLFILLIVFVLVSPLLIYLTAPIRSS
jgi:uncharacterized membrane protein YoaK (UPF0700 family)